MAEQNLQQFVNQSTWDPVPVRRRIAERMVPQIGPDAWAVDDVSFPKDGRMSVAIAHQHCGALGKQANCQVAVSVHAVSEAASCPLQWRLFVPEEWADDLVRQHKTGIPEEVGHREKWRLALDSMDELAGWGLVPPVVVADAGYGQNADFRDGLERQSIGKQMLALLTQLEAACTAADQLAEAVEEAFHQHPDAEILLSFPGLGIQLAARILAEIGDDRTRFADARGLKAYAGASPVTRSSGKKSSITRRWVKNDRLNHAGRLGSVRRPSRHPSERNSRSQPTSYCDSQWTELAILRYLHQ